MRCYSEAHDDGECSIVHDSGGGCCCPCHDYEMSVSWFWCPDCDHEFESSWSEHVCPLCGVLAPGTRAELEARQG